MIDFPVEIIQLKDLRRVSICDYIKAKTNQLIEFGYNDLKEETVGLELKKILTKSNEELTVIGHFVIGDIDDLFLKNISNE